jgi:hypothetical protein
MARSDFFYFFYRPQNYNFISEKEAFNVPSDKKVYKSLIFNIKKGWNKKRNGTLQKTWQPDWLRPKSAVVRKCSRAAFRSPCTTFSPHDPQASTTISGGYPLFENVMSKANTLLGFKGAGVAANEEWATVWNKGSDWRIPFYLRCFVRRHLLNDLYRYFFLTAFLQIISVRLFCQ